jgi:copper oxidase (laccase) domain-containing protein
MRTTYNRDTFTRYVEVDSKQKGIGMLDNEAIIADAIITKDLDHALFITVADCIGAVIFDTKKQILMLCHLGRHSIEEDGAYRSVMHLIENYGCDPHDLSVHLTPSPGQKNYPLFAFDGHSMKDVTINQLILAGVIKDNITNDNIDTSSDLRYFSYSEFLKGNRKEYGNNAVLAMMKS